MEIKVICLSMVDKLLGLKQKILKFVPYPLCLGDISKDFSIANATGFMDMFMILVSIIKPLQIIKYIIFTGI